MADITMCINKDCPLQDCYRLIAKPDQYNQSYCSFPKIIDQEGIFRGCEYYYTVAKNIKQHLKEESQWVTQ